jgi:tRNA threonylcarbamoyladenosine biosynthesis protein TsaB
VILGIDTSGKICNVTLYDGERIREEFSEKCKNHSIALLPQISKITKNVKIEKIAVAVGPGSYTGLRIGISAAKSLAFGWNIECVGISTLLAIAAGSELAKKEEFVCPYMPARENIVYAGIYKMYKEKFVSVFADSVLSFEEFTAEARKFNAEDKMVKYDENPLSAKICMLAAEEKSVSPFELNPSYLQEFKLN